jgi:hypothetical protein
MCRIKIKAYGVTPKSPRATFQGTICGTSQCLANTILYLLLGLGILPKSMRATAKKPVPVEPEEEDPNLRAAALALLRGLAAKIKDGADQMAVFLANFEAGMRAAQVEQDTLAKAVQEAKEVNIEAPGASEVLQKLVGSMEANPLPSAPAPPYNPSSEAFKVADAQFPALSAKGPQVPTGHKPDQSRAQVSPVEMDGACNTGQGPYKGRYAPIAYNPFLRASVEARQKFVLKGKKSFAAMVATTPGPKAQQRRPTYRHGPYQPTLPQNLESMQTIYCSNWRRSTYA